MEETSARRALVSGLLLLALGREVRAGTAEQAKRHFEEATNAYNLGEFKRAAEEYREAYRIKPAAAILYNIAQAYRLGNEPEQALFFYRSYLRNDPATRNRREVEDRIQKLEQQLAQQKAPPNDIVKPDSSPSEPPPRVVVSAEAATVRADLVQAPPRTPVYKKWWLWTAVGVAAVGVGLGVGLGLGLRSDGPSTHFGNVNVF